jgi:hypothetical protein
MATARIEKIGEGRGSPCGEEAQRDKEVRVDYMTDRQVNQASK